MEGLWEERGRKIVGGRLREEECGRCLEGMWEEFCGRNVRRSMGGL